MGRSSRADRHSPDSGRFPWVTASACGSVQRGESVNGKQHAVLWLGFTLIALRLFTTQQWSLLWGTVTSGSPGPAAEIGAGMGQPQSSSTIKNVTGAGTGATTVKGGAATGTTPGTSLGNPAAGGGAPY
jgi:hypothetical protein